MKHLLTLALLLCLGTFASAQIPSYVPTNGLVGWWPFNGNANDESGNGNNGTVNGATLAADRFGNAGRAYSFNGLAITNANRSKISIQNIDIKNYLTTGFTLSFWFTRTDSINSANRHFIFFQYNGVNGGQSEYTLNSFRLGLRTATANPPEINYFHNFTGSYSSWHQAVMVWSPYSMSSYIDGILVNTVSNSGINNFTNGQLFTLGSGGVSGSYSHHGKLDDVGIWNRALTAAEVQQLYSGQSACNLTVNLATSDTLAACGNSVTLNAGNPGANYLWNTGDSTPTISATQSGWYGVTVTQNNCSATDSVYVNLLQVDLGNDTTVCQNSTVGLGIKMIGFQNTISNNLKNGLVAWYGMDGNAFDKSGNGYHGTIEGNPINYSTPNKNYLYFDDYIPVIDRINLPQSLSTQYNNLNQGAISLWLNIDSFIRNNHYFNWDNIFLAKQKDGQNSQLDLGILRDTNKLRFHLNGPHPGANQLISNSSLQQKTWYHVLVQWDGTKMQFFINGKFDNEFLTNITLTNMPNPDYFSIGMCPGVGSGGSFSKIDEVMFYNRTLTNSEINQLFIYASTPTSTLWSTGDTTPTINVTPTQTTTYYCTVSDGISTCTDSVTVFVTQPPVLSLPDTLRSATRPVVLAPGNASTYLWSTGDTTSNLSVNTAGTYSVTATNVAGCSSADTVLVLFSNPAPALPAPAAGMFNYQASVVSGGKPLSNRSLSVRFTVADSTATNYSEIQQITTDARGHFATQVGAGIALSGSLSDVSWWDGLSRTLKTEVDTNGSGNWVVLGSSSLVAVPVSMYALRSGDGSRSIYGSFDSNGNVVSGRGFTVTPLGNGKFELVFQQPFTELPNVIVKLVGSGTYGDKIINRSNQKATIEITGNPDQIQFEAKGK